MIKISIFSKNDIQKIMELLPTSQEVI